jgi:hypothetical protein
MHRALLLLAILELPGGLRMQLPPGVCAVINVRKEVSLYTKFSKERLLWITPDAFSFSGESARCDSAVVTAGTFRYGVTGTCAMVKRIAAAPRMLDAKLERPRSDATCSIQPILTFISMGPGPAPIGRRVTIWSDGAFESDQQRGLLTIGEVNEVRSSRRISRCTITR